ncbi:hypothetical protein B5M09_011952 [Aphanomyces astaci]|uniref:Uncharacterized protein n=1 Tax=Aphanomyces astaci TaxID=112090 RepID=A0A425D184_APHAT|nr:hypothetical protein B5M09_011952 [Aphanomyces astaci]
MAANSKDPNIKLLVFNGIKKSYRFWTQKFDIFGEDQPVHLLWATVQKRYGKSNVNTVKILVGHLILTANTDFPNLEVLFCDLKSCLEHYQPKVPLWETTFRFALLLMFCQYDVGGQPHVKSECPKRKEDFWRKEFRSNSKRPKVDGAKIP